MVCMRMQHILFLVIASSEVLAIGAFAASDNLETAVAVYRQKKDAWYNTVWEFLRGAAGVGTFILDVSKDIIHMVAEKIIDRAFQKDCLNVNKECSCGWGRCHENAGIIAAGCCKEGFSWTCCEHAKQAQDECNKLCKNCGWGECHPAVGLKPKATDCCAQGYSWRCCEKAPPILEGCKKKAAECTNCTWGDCHPSTGFASDGCCTVGHQFKCCENAPEVLTPCEKMAAKCLGNWGECFSRDGYKGDACCDKGNAWKCGYDMTTDELILKDPAYAKMMNCYLAGHPDTKSLKMCMPDESECKVARTCHVPYDDIERCAKKVKCMQRKHSNWDAVRQCLGSSVYNGTACNDPLPPIESATETTKTQTAAPTVPAIFSGIEKQSYVNITTAGNNCSEFVREVCPCKWALCVEREGYSRTNCCPVDYDLVCCAKKAIPFQDIKYNAEHQTPNASESPMTNQTTASSDGIRAIGCAKMAVVALALFGIFVRRMM
uniref:Uncharacterized protein n=1 Tax=Globodera rostochiensis TaxID=31243 RepID=A0A914I9Z4_GLORO